MGLFLGIIVLIIYCCLPLFVQIIVFVADFALTGFGIDEILLIAAMILRKWLKD